MSLDPSSGSQPPAPHSEGNLDPRIVLVIALVIGGLGAHYVNWETAFFAFHAVLSLFAPRSNS